MMPYPHYQAGILADSSVNFSAYRPSHGAGLMAVRGNPTDGSGRATRLQNELSILIKTTTYWHTR